MRVPFAAFSKQPSEGCCCQCVTHDTCSGIEFKEGFADGTNECIMVRTMDTHEQVHAAAGWTIYARPEVGDAIFAGGGGGGH